MSTHDGLALERHPGLCETRFSLLTQIPDEEGRRATAGPVERARLQAKSAAEHVCLPTHKRERARKGNLTRKTTGIV
jgi:hypothetical protein